MSRKKWVLFAAVALALAGGFTQTSVWDRLCNAYPVREINLTVPYAIGGATDQTARILATLMSRSLGKNMVVANTPAEGGITGHMTVYHAPRDGYTLLCNGMLPFTSMAVRGYAKDAHQSWHVWMATTTPNVVVVRADSVYRNMGMLVTALRSRPGNVLVAQSGAGSAGQLVVSALQQALGVSFSKIRTFSGGRPAVKALLDGEVDFTAQLLAECITEIRSGQLRALASYTEEDIVVLNGPVVPTILRTVPKMANHLPAGEVMGIALPKGASEEVVRKLDKAFEVAVNSKEFKDFCRTNGFLPAVQHREATGPFLDKFASVSSWSLYDAGEAKFSPEQFGIRRP